VCDLLENEEWNTPEKLKLKGEIEEVRIIVVVVGGGGGGVKRGPIGGFVGVWGGPRWT